MTPLLTTVVARDIEGEASIHEAGGGPALATVTPAYSGGRLSHWVASAPGQPSTPYLTRDLALDAALLLALNVKRDARWRPV